MKNRLFFSVLISVSLLAPAALQANSFWPECGMIGLGAATSLYGLNMIAKSGGKDGNPAKGLLGLCITGGGGMIMAKGPGWVRSKNQPLSKVQYPLCKTTALSNFPILISREKNRMMKLALHAYELCLKYAPCNMIPIHPKLYH